MAILGSHMSIAGGYYKAVEAAHRVGCDCVQLFTKNNNQWRAKAISDEDSQRFRTALAELGITHPISHDSYLINLASPDEELWRKSIDAFVVELQRAEQLGIPYVVAHPGAYTSSTESQGLKRIIQALDEVHRQTKGCRACCLVETTAGQGSNLGWKFEQLATILDGVRDPDRLGVCFDTCHVFAAGYPMDTEKSYKSTMRSFNQVIEVKKIRAFHLNDSLKPLGSRVDRHAGIGRGEMGLQPFRFLLNDRRFRKVPMYLETPKGEEKGKDLDVVNLKTLRGLIAG
ncbi:MAG: deoxyribonuclease IV [Planctomycetales bacterium]|nr:deoxyribonuclease IV [Planctomycetales bacterium]